VALVPWLVARWAESPKASGCKPDTHVVNTAKKRNRILEPKWGRACSVRCSNGRFGRI